MREFHADVALELIDREQITHFGGVEAMFRLMIASPNFQKTSFKSVLYINSAGAPCSSDVMKNFWDRGIPVTQSYGLTEAGPSNFILLPDGYTMDEVKKFSDSIGFSMFHCDAKILDPGTGKPVRPGQIGELCLRSPHNFEGYLDDPERTAKIVDAEGWVYSGDLAWMDESGYVRIIGRADNMFISGGENISPEEIEQALLRHPAVAQVGAVGVPDAQWGQVGLAAVVLKPAAQMDEARLKEFCRTQLASFKVPKYIRFVPALPLTGAGKVDRKALAKLIETKGASS
jgi:fatty-acyl-CoA synthase